MVLHPQKQLCIVDRLCDVSVVGLPHVLHVISERLHNAWFHIVYGLPAVAVVLQCKFREIRLPALDRESFSEVRLEVGHVLAEICVTLAVTVIFSLACRNCCGRIPYWWDRCGQLRGVIGRSVRV